MGLIKPVHGVPWSDGVIANCRWGGVLVSDLLKYAGISLQGDVNRHICFESHATLCQDDSYYGASIPLSPDIGHALLAYEVRQ